MSKRYWVDYYIRSYLYKREEPSCSGTLASDMCQLNIERYAQFFWYKNDKNITVQFVKPDISDIMRGQLKAIENVATYQDFMLHLRFLVNRREEQVRDLNERIELAKEREAWEENPDGHELT